MTGRRMPARVGVMEMAGRPRSARDVKIAALKAKRLGKEKAEANEAARKKEPTVTVTTRRHCP